MKDVSKLVVLSLFSLVSAGTITAGPVTINFEGLMDGELIQDYYNGGSGSLGTGPGAQLGIVFSGVTALKEREGGTGGFSGEPSTPTVAFSNLFVTADVPGGFTDSISFWYSSPGGTVTLRIYSQPGQRGELGTFNFGSSPITTFTFANASFNGVATSLALTSRGLGGVYIDDLSLIEQSVAPAPEPSFLLPLVTGLIVICLKRMPAEVRPGQ